MTTLDGVDIEVGGDDSDPELLSVVARFKSVDPTGQRAARVFRATFDQLYDGQRTGRYKWDQLYKTEKTHYGTLIEINLRREFSDILQDGIVLDYKVDGVEVDCKYSYRFGGWMIPPEAFGRLLLVTTASDENSEWAMGVVRASESNLRAGANRDGKTGLTRSAYGQIAWIGYAEELPPNVLLQIDVEAQELIFRPKSGQKRINELFRQVLNRRIGRNTIATVAQQDDFMKRVRANGGARTALASEGLIIAGGDYEAHRDIVRKLGGVVPEPGEFVSLCVVPAEDSDLNCVELDGRAWRIGDRSEWKGERSPLLPSVKQ